MNDIVQRLRDWADQTYEVQLGEIPQIQEDMREAADRIEADHAAMQQAVKACSLAVHALTFAPASYEELLSTRHDAVDDLRAAKAALQERLKCEREAALERMADDAKQTGLDY